MSRNDASNFFATHYQVAPYFMLEFSSLTKLLGVAIISRDELESDVTYDILNTDDPSITNETVTVSINGIVVRAGAFKIVDVCEHGEQVGSPAFISCSMWTGNDYCGELNLDMDVLPLREYTIPCKNPIIAKFLSIQLPTPDGIKRSLTFEKMSVIRGNLMNKQNTQDVAKVLEGSSGIFCKWFWKYKYFFTIIL